MAGILGWYRDRESGQFVFDAYVVVNAPIDVCFMAWANFESFPQLMRYISDVHRLDDTTWHWEATLAGRHVEWNATTTEFRPNEIIAWASTDGIKNTGAVYFSPEDDRACRVAIHLLYDPAYGVLGDLLARWRVNNAFLRDLQQDLDNFKRSVESGTAEDYRRAA